MLQGGKIMFIFTAGLAAEMVDDAIYKADAATAFNNYCDTVYRLAFLRTGNTADADDIMSEVFLRLIRNTSKIKSEEHLKAWLIRATINRSNSFFKNIPSPFGEGFFCAQSNF